MYVKIRNAASIDIGITDVTIAIVVLNSYISTAIISSIAIAIPQLVCRCGGLHLAGLDGHAAGAAAAAAAALYCSSNPTTLSVAFHDSF